MKFNHNIDWFAKYSDEEFSVEFDFTNDLTTGDSISTATVVVYDEDKVDVTNTLIDGTPSVSSPDVSFTVQAGTSGKTYEIVIQATTASGNIYTHRVIFEVFDSVTLNSKLGDRVANSYITLAQANEYIRNKYGHSSTWDTLSIEGKKRVLLQATRDIDRFRFYGEKYYESQPLQFPRDDHEVVTGNCATPLTTTTFKHANLYSTTYGEMPQDYWKYGSIHITAATPINETGIVASSNVTTGLIHFSALSAAPTTNSQFIVFAPIYRKFRDAQCEQALYLVANNKMDALLDYKNLGAQMVKIGDTIVTFNDSGFSSLSISPVAKKLLSQFIDRSLLVYRK